MAAVLAGTDPDAPPERAVHGLDAAEAAGGGDLGHAQVGGLQQPAGLLMPAQTRGHPPSERVKCAPTICPPGSL